MDPSANREIKQSLDVFMSGDDPNAYTKPITSEDELIARGLIDQNGVATSKGVLFTDLQDIGMVNENGTLSEKGYAYSMPIQETFKRENKWAFKVREQDGVDDTDTSWGDLVGAVGDFVWDTGAGLVTIGLSDQAPTREASLAPLIGAAEGSVKSTEELLGLAGVGTGLLTEQFSKLIGMDKAGEDILWDARQDNARIQYENQAAKAGSTIDGYVPAAQATETMASAKRTMPPEEYAALVKQTNATGSLLDPTVFLPAGAAAKAGKLGVTTRLALKAENVIARTAALDAAIAKGGVELAALERMAQTSKTASTLAAKLGDDLAEKFSATGDRLLAKRANQAREVAERTSQAAAVAPEKAASVAADLEKLTATRNALATRIPEQAALATRRAMEIGTAVKSAPLRAILPIAEGAANALTWADDRLFKIGQAYGGKKAYAALSMAAGATGLAFGGIPGLATAGAVIAAGPVLKSTANFARIVGKEMVKARGQIPFWQRVANYSDLSPMHRGISHMIDTATAGGAVPGAIRRIGTGAVAAYPVDLFFEYLADGGDPNADTFKRAAAESLVIGGSSAALGGMFQGTKSRHRELALGDEFNFRENITDPIQKATFAALPPSTRRSVATYSAANPQLNFRFSDTGGGSFDRSTNTVTVNPTSPNPLKPLIAHEVLHSVAVRHQMEGGISALLIGDGESGGLLRAADGTLDPLFQKFWNNYNKASGKTISLNEAALEYFIDSSADHVAGLAESGELGNMAGRTKLRRNTIDPLIETILPRLPIIKDLHYKLGGLRDAEGRMVMGSGLLADGLRELPEVKRMTREMLRKSSGISQGGFTPLGAGKGKEDAGGAVIPIRKEDVVLTKKLGIPIFQTEEVNGRTQVVLDSTGTPKNIDRATDEARGKISNIVQESLAEPDAVSPEPGQITKDAEGEISGAWLGSKEIKAIEGKGKLNQEQLRILKNINDTIRGFDGSRFNVTYFPAMTKVGKKNRHGSLAPTVRDVVPVAIKVEKSGVLNVALMSATQLEANINARIDSKRGKRLYSGNKDALINDLNDVMKIHLARGETDTFFREKYGAQNGPEYKNFVNTVFGLMTDSQRTGVVHNGVKREPNPIFDEDKVGYSSNVFKTYRVDRIANAVKLSHDLKVPMPFVYDSVKLNLMPMGVPTLDAQGNPVAK